MQVWLDKEGRVLEHRVEQVERALQRRQVVQVVGDLHARARESRVSRPRIASYKTQHVGPTCSPPHAMRYGTS